MTLAGSIAGALQKSPALQLTPEQIGLTGSAYLAGAVLGALLFGWLTDRLGRRRLFMVTLGVYLVATAATAFAWDFWCFALFRFLTGAGIGGEYAAINSAIQELIPARYRGRTDLAINGSFWLGAALGARRRRSCCWTRAACRPNRAGALAFGIGAVLGLVILLLRRCAPGEPALADAARPARRSRAVVGEIEARVVASDARLHAARP